MTGSAEPNAFGRENFFRVTVLNVAEELVGQDVHREIERTSGRTLLTLKTVLYFLSAFLKNLGQQRHILAGYLPALVHSSTPVLGREVFPGVIQVHHISG
jgi:hypothetical protein